MCLEAADDYLVTSASFCMVEIFIRFSYEPFFGELLLDERVVYAAAHRKCDVLIRWGVWMSELEIFELIFEIFEFMCKYLGRIAEDRDDELFTPITCAKIVLA